METPLPSRRITRSQALAANNAESTQKKKSGKHQERDKQALIDITNGSPIIGLAMGSSLKTPLSRCSKKRMVSSNTESMNNMTPGSGESLLRGQVKTLLQKVEEEDMVISKTCFEPQVCDFSTTGGHNGWNLFTQMLNEVVSAPNQGDKDVVTRSLLLDFYEKSHDSDSVKVNASTSEEYDEDLVVVDELCEGMSKMSVNNVVKFSGKHTRFVYNSDGELEGEVSSSSISEVAGQSKEEKGVGVF